MSIKNRVAANNEALKFPGDFIQIKMNGDLLINGSMQKEPYVKYSGGKSGSFVIPQNEYFVLGDNRAGSNDSRHWKKPTITSKDIQGKVKFSLYPFRKV